MNTPSTPAHSSQSGPSAVRPLSIHRRFPAGMRPLQPCPQPNPPSTRTNALNTQDVIIASSIIVAVGAAIANGLKGEPVVCDSCGGTGGLKCFACEGTGKMMGVKRDDLYSKAQSDPSKRDFFGRDSNPRQCKVCAGAGVILCKKCQGTGYMKRL